jgi:hypothetical protein
VGNGRQYINWPSVDIFGAVPHHSTLKRIFLLNAHAPIGQTGVKLQYIRPNDSSAIVIMSCPTQNSANLKFSNVSMQII